MRRSFDALSLVVQQVMREDPLSGALYVFVGKRPTRAKVLWWDRNGMCVLYKRLHRAQFKIPETCVGTGPAVRIDAAALAHLLAGVESTRSRRKSLN